VRAAVVEMWSTTNKYNRGECRQALRACVADKGGCGVGFENCLDAKLLERRTLSCENVLDQCMNVRDYVLEDWKDESKEILKQAAIDADKNMRQTCYTKIRACLEDGCSVSIDFGKSDGSATNSGCLTNVNVAAGVCPIIDECEAKIPGIKASVKDLLTSLRTDFCQNDVDRCLREKCGENFTGPQCVGKSSAEIVELCPKKMFSACKDEKFYDIIVSSVLLQMNYQMMQGCINYYADALGKVCGTDMNCLPSSYIVAGLKKTPSDIGEIKKEVAAESKAAVDEFFKRFETEATVAACKSAQQPANSGRKSLRDSIFADTKQAAEFAAQIRYQKDLDSKLDELSRKEDVTKAEQNCYARYQVEKKTSTDEKGTYSYIKSVSFEPSLRNCHVCRMQRVCETGGESKAASALKAGAGGLTAGASMGTMVNAGWGTLIGAVVGGAAGAVGGALSGGEQTFCQEIESCEDINM
jgi:hypothetical protein